MATQIPIIGAHQQQPTYPQVNLNLTPQGLNVTIQIGPTTAIVQFIDAGTMDQVAKQWRESRKHSDDLLRAVQSSKI